jgi:hypothetical protein
MKKYNIEFDIAIRNPEIVIQKGKQFCDQHTWEVEVENCDGNELDAAISLLFGGGFGLSDDLDEAIDFLGSSCGPDGETPPDWDARVFPSWSQT